MQGLLAAFGEVCSPAQPSPKTYDVMSSSASIGARFGEVIEYLGIEPFTLLLEDISALLFEDIDPGDTSGEALLSAPKPNF